MAGSHGSSVARPRCKLSANAGCHHALSCCVAQDDSRRWMRRRLPKMCEPSGGQIGRGCRSGGPQNSWCVRIKCGKWGSLGYAVYPRRIQLGRRHCQWFGRCDTTASTRRVMFSTQSVSVVSTVRPKPMPRATCRNRTPPRLRNSRTYMNQRRRRKMPSTLLWYGGMVPYHTRATALWSK